MAPPLRRLEIATGPVHAKSHLIRPISRNKFFLMANLNNLVTWIDSKLNWLTRLLILVRTMLGNNAGRNVSV